MTLSKADVRGDAMEVAAGALSSEGRRPFFGRCDWCSFGLTAGLTLTVYLFSLAPEVGIGLEGDFVTGAVYAAVPAPPGYPLWTLYAHCFSLLPFSNPAWRVAISSAVAASLACGLVALIVCRGGSEMLQAAATNAGLTAADERRLAVVAGCVAGAGLGFDGGFWPSAVAPGPWTLSVLLLIGVLCLLFRWAHEPNRRRYLYGAALVYGLALSNSQILFSASLGLEILVMLADPRVVRQACLVNTVLFGACLWAWHQGLWPMLDIYAGEFNVPYQLFLVVGCGSAATSLFLIIRSRRLLCECRAALVCLLLVLLGLSIHLYSPLASMSNPPVNWGYSRTAEGFVHLVTRGQYDRMTPTATWERFAGQLAMYARLAWTDLGGPYCLAALLPLAFLRSTRSRERRWLLGLLAVYLCLVLVLLDVLNPPPDIASRPYCRVFFSLPHAVLSIWAGYGLMLLGARLRASR